MIFFSSRRQSSPSDFELLEDEDEELEELEEEEEEGGRVFFLAGTVPGLNPAEGFMTPVTNDDGFSLNC